uniref:lipoyl(octanoyl) transferase n=1 Tax=Elaeophora elaphi TaxID=1147741 RepID=A0A0R3RQ81_9BILA
MFFRPYRYSTSLRLIHRQLFRSFSNYEEIDLSKPCTVICKSGTIACWHPERSFPYEHSKPIDLKKLEAEKQSSGVLSKEIECIADLQGSLARKGPRNYILREIFYTGKHEWYTRTFPAETLYFILLFYSALIFSYSESDMRFDASSMRYAADAIWLGRITYADGLKQQHYYVDKVLAARKLGSDSRRKSYLLLLEHTPVYTVGIRHFQYNEDEENRLKKLGAEFYRTKRGGLITFHGPGQLVVYPIIDLRSLHVKGPDQNSALVGVRRYVYLVEEVVIKTVCSFGLLGAGRSPNTGVWLGNGMRKIAALGINVRDGIVSHGLALNCNTDLNWFHQIVPCGLVGKEVTSLTQELGRNVSVNDVFPILCDKFAEVFHFDVNICSSAKFCENDHLQH